MQPTHFLYLLRPPRPSFLVDSTDAERAIMGTHAAYHRELAAKGKVLMAGPSLDGAWGVGILNVIDADEARRIAEGDPAVTSGLMQFQLHPVAFGIRAP